MFNISTPSAGLMKPKLTFTMLDSFWHSFLQCEINPGKLERINISTEIGFIYVRENGTVLDSLGKKIVNVIYCLSDEKVIWSEGKWVNSLEKSSP